jgi:hypothetical protein
MFLLILTAHEYAMVSDVVQRRFMSMTRDAQNKPSIKEDRLFQAYEDLAKLFAQQAPPESSLNIMSVNTNRHHLRLLESLTSAHVKALTDHILPGYYERAKVPGQEEKMKPYIAKAESAVDSFNKVKKKVMEGL